MTASGNASTRLKRVNREDRVNCVNCVNGMNGVTYSNCVNCVNRVNCQNRKALKSYKSWKSCTPKTCISCPHLCKWISSITSFLRSTRALGWCLLKKSSAILDLTTCVCWPRRVQEDVRGRSHSFMAFHLAGIDALWLTIWLRCDNAEIFHMNTIWIKRFLQQTQWTYFLKTDAL